MGKDFIHPYMPNSVPEIKQEMLLLKMENRHGINFKEAVKIKMILKTDMPLEELFFWESI